MLSDKELQDQIATLSRGADRLVPEDDLHKRLADAARDGRPLRIKLGMDPTAPDLHLGHTVVLRKLKAFQDFGHQAVVIVGDFTARIGDPSGRAKTRPALTHEEIESNLQTYIDQIGSVLDVDRLEVVRNGDWFRNMSFAEMMALASKVTVAQLLARDDFRKRFDSGSPIALHELFYPVMQAYDSVMVRSDVEIGGTDQTFNILMGRDMQEAFGQAPQLAMLHPLIPGLDGAQKMSKSLGNTIAVCDPPDEMFGKLMRIPDDLMETYFRVLTDMPAPDIQRFVSGAFHPKEAKMILAKTIVATYYDAETAEKAACNFDRVFKEGGLPEDIPGKPIADLPLADGTIWIVKLLASLAFCPSNSEARRLIKQGCVSINGGRITDVHAMIQPYPGMLVRVGKRRICRIT